MAELIAQHPPQKISESPAEAARQVKIKARAETVDIVRGFALFGILFINIMTFRSTNIGWTGLDHAVDTLSLILAEGKFVTTFMILFGLSFTFQAKNSGSEGFTAQYLRRIGMLLVFGVLHFVLLWEGDILMQYVIPGFLLLLFAHSQPRTILSWAGIFYGLLLVFVLVVSLSAASQPAGQSTASGDPTVAPIIYETGSYGQIMQARLELLPAFESEHFFSAFLLFGIFLLGAYIGKRGFLSRPGEHLRLLRLVLICGLPLGVFANAVRQFGQPYVNTVAFPQQFAIYLCTFFGPTILSLAYIAGVSLLAYSVKWLKPLASVGRMTLTNYLMQSLIFTTIFYHYGLGLYDKIGPTSGIILITAIFGLQIAISVVWMRYFRYGPVEWLWRSVTYWRFEPMRKHAMAAKS